MAAGVAPFLFNYGLLLLAPLQGRFIRRAAALCEGDEGRLRALVVRAQFFASLTQLVVTCLAAMVTSVIVVVILGLKHTWTTEFSFLLVLTIIVHSVLVGVLFFALPLMHPDDYLATETSTGGKRMSISQKMLAARILINSMAMGVAIAAYQM
jgi:hypothetical protein